MVMAGKARRRALTLALIALTLATSPASARQWSAVCSNLSGVRVDDPAAEPTFTQDVLKGASWAYSWNTDTRKATLILPASHASDGRSHKQEGVVSVHRGGWAQSAMVCYPRQGTYYSLEHATRRVVSSHEAQRESSNRPTFQDKAVNELREPDSRPYEGITAWPRGSGRRQ